VKLSLAGPGVDAQALVHRTVAFDAAEYKGAADPGDESAGEIALSETLQK
jgi:hypothetical protein